MRAILFVLILLAAIPTAAGAQEPEPGDADRAAIREVISSQIAAFRRDDARAAFAFASPGIQRLFGDADRFMDMVRGGYAPVYAPRAFAFADLAVVAGTIVQAVDVTGPDGRRVVALYEMERQPDGSWRISGCTLVEPPDASA